MYFGKSAIGAKKSQPEAVISLARTQIQKFTKDHCGTIPIRWCLLCIHCFLVVLLAHGPHKCANAQIAVPA
jgi:hypothetical protein